MGLTSFVIELGDVVERNLKNKAVLIALILLAALFHVVSFILLGIIILTVYARSRKGPVPFRQERDEKETGAIIAGIALFGFGLYYLVRIYVPDIGWQIAFLMVGSLLIAFGLSRGGGVVETD
jgi:sulfite exporter TauE/SafE